MQNQINQRERALDFVKELSFDDAYFKILLKLACLSSSAKIHKELYGTPKRCSIFKIDANPFWAQWDFGRALVTLLVEYCRPREIDPTKSHFWNLLDSHYQQSYFEQYEFEKEVVVEHGDFEALCKAITNDNIAHIDDYKLSPKEIDEAIGHYGEEVFWRKWLLEHKTNEPKVFHTDCYSLAEEVFKIVNDRSVNSSERGEISNKLLWYSLSCFD
ncbi:hypothetical protein [Pseudoalteromonas prydzensis]|uniref:hypothetical protein n=1 Tax=Pseudoalteromonas prydzensis TaxID=182141 RepID=UPI003FD61790